MTARYDLNAPIETLFKKITDNVAYTELGEAPFTSKKIVDIVLRCLARRLEGVESEATPRPRLEHLQSAFYESASRVEGKLSPYNRKKISPCQRR